MRRLYQSVVVSTFIRFGGSESTCASQLARFPICSWRIALSLFGNPSTRRGIECEALSVSNDTGIPARTVREHYQILEDTLIGFQIPPFKQTQVFSVAITS